MKRQFFKSFFGFAILIQLHLSTAFGLFNSPTCNSYIDTIAVIFLQPRINSHTGLPLITPLEMNFSFYPERNKLVKKSEKVNTRILYIPGAADKPVVYLWNGLGSSAKASYSSYLMDQLNMMGFTVVSIPSTLNQKDTLGFSKHVRPGLSSADLPDLMRLTHVISKELVDRHQIQNSKKVLMGVSMGAFQAAAVLSRPEYEKEFEKYVLINPPMDLRYGIDVLDYLVDGGNGLSSRRKDEVEQVENEYLTAASLSEDPRELSEQLQRRQFGEKELGYLIGSSMRSSVQGATLSSQVIQDDGVLKKKTSFGKSREIKSWSIKKYFDLVALPFFDKLFKENGSTLDLDYELSIWPHLHFAPRPQNVLMLHSVDDFISNPYELKKLHQLPIQTVLTKCGGHVGALAYPLFQVPLKNFMKDL